MPARGILRYEKERSFGPAKGGEPQEGSFFGWDGVSCSAGEVRDGAENVRANGRGLGEPY